MALVHETRAMDTARRALDPRSPSKRARALTWAAHRYGMLVRAEGIMATHKPRADWKSRSSMQYSHNDDRAKADGQREKMAIC